MRNPQTNLHALWGVVTVAWLIGWATEPVRSFDPVEPSATFAVLATSPATRQVPKPSTRVQAWPLPSRAAGGSAPAASAKDDKKMRAQMWEGRLTWYGLRHPNGQLYHGRRTKSGRKFSQNELTCAVPNIKGTDKPIVPYGTKLRFTIENGNTLIATATDLCRGGTWDQSTAGIKALGFKKLNQNVWCRVEVVQ